MKTQLLSGKFEIQKEIAKGKTGTIFYGYDNDLRQEVAIKAYHSHINRRVIRPKPFIDKAKPLLLLDHPNLIKIFKVEDDDDTAVVFMEFFDAPNLERVIRENGPLSLHDTLDIARVIAEVLVHTHLQGIIHGTLHPGHILVGPYHQIKVMDLGLSWILMDILTECDVDLLRPLHYLPPELAQGELLSVSSDLYCLGLMMYHMLTKSTPYEGLPNTSIMGRLTFDKADPEFHFPDDTPPAICQLIQDMTRHKPQDRIQEATHVLTVIDQQLAKAPQDTKIQDQPESLLAETTEPSPPPPTAPRHQSAPETLDSPTPESQDPTIKRTPSVHRPKHQPKYERLRENSIYKKLGFILGVVLLICGAIGGYWFRGLIDDTASDVPSPSLSPPETTPTSLPSPALPVESQTPPSEMTNRPQEAIKGVGDMTDRSLNDQGPQNQAHTTSPQIPPQQSPPATSPSPAAEDAVGSINEPTLPSTQADTLSTPPSQSGNSTPEFQKGLDSPSSANSPPLEKLPPISTSESLSTETK